MRGMELRHLRYFVAVAQEGNLTRAAARLFITQPALSRQMKDLEKLLGVTLFFRTASGMSLTPAGREFLPQARQITEQSAEAMLSMRRFTECRNSSLAIGYIAPALGSFLGAALQIFRQKHAQIEIKLFELSPGRQIEALREGRLDIALIGHADRELNREFQLMTIRRIALVAALNSAHPLAGRAAIKIRELQNETFIGLDETTFPGRGELVRSVCRRAGFTPRIAHEADGLSSLLALIGSNVGIGIMPDDVQQLPSSNVAFKPLRAPQSHINFSAALASDDKRLPVRALLEECRHVAESENNGRAKS